MFWDVWNGVKGVSGDGNKLVVERDHYDFEISGKIHDGGDADTGVIILLNRDDLGLYIHSVQVKRSIYFEKQSDSAVLGRCTDVYVDG